MKTSTQSRRIGLTLGALAIAALLPLAATNSARAYGPGCPFLGYGGGPKKLNFCNPPMVGGGGGAYAIRSGAYRSGLGYHGWRR